MYEAIPEELKQIPQWVCVRDNSKVPMQANADKAAASNNSATWADFTSAVNAVMDKRYDGLGFVFHANGIVGIDIDAGFDTDGLLSDLSIDCIGVCRSYTELSRSGRGVHILVRGTLPFKGKNNGNGIEIYSTGRYFIMTGKQLIYPEIIENQTAIDYIVSKYFPDVLKETTGGKKMKSIYTPAWNGPKDGKVKLRPEYTAILPGMRNDSLTSLAGQLRSAGYSDKDIFTELMTANERACTPPLSRREVENIVRSVTRYKK